MIYNLLCIAAAALACFSTADAFGVGVPACRVPQVSVRVETNQIACAAAPRGPPKRFAWQLVVFVEGCVLLKIVHISAVGRLVVRIFFGRNKRAVLLSLTLLPS